MRKWIYGVLGVVLVGAVAALTLYLNPKLSQRIFLKPSAAFDEAAAPPAPDYATPEAWVALPDRADMADLLPPDTDIQDRQSDAEIDVFFVHPTTYYSDDQWNAAFDEQGSTKEMLESGVMRFQASIFNGSGRIYAPRYRQATLYSFMGEEPDTYEALTFAYGDVERAFDHFLSKMSNGRPFILASHSQGSLHAMKLLQDKIAGTNLANRMIAAYIVGFSIPEDLGTENIGPCRDKNQTGCYLNWNSVTADAKTMGWKETTKIWIDGKLQHIAGRPIACVNPLTGSLGGVAEAAANLGGQPFSDADEPVRPLIPALTGAACQDGMLIVSPPTDDDGLTFGMFGGDYHIYDYNLFHLNIRQDIALRVSAFWKR
ncbi:MAG: DUF3089 domain-containing protein [Parvibaculum sp.]